LNRRGTPNQEWAILDDPKKYLFCPNFKIVEVWEGVRSSELPTFCYILKQQTQDLGLRENRVL
jgi:hypothetical protein